MTCNNVLPEIHWYSILSRRFTKLSKWVLLVIYLYLILHYKMYKWLTSKLEQHTSFFTIK
jgi:hypothetical protein